MFNTEHVEKQIQRSLSCKRIQNRGIALVARLLSTEPKSTVLGKDAFLHFFVCKHLFLYLLQDKMSPHKSISCNYRCYYRFCIISTQECWGEEKVQEQQGTVAINRISQSHGSFQRHLQLTLLLKLALFLHSKQ